MFKRSAYCTSCKQQRFVLNHSYETVKRSKGNPRKVIKGTCVDCGASIYQFIKNGGKFNTLLKIFDW
jgi:nitrate/TMAO reductase-like tetraheme cytochrome c subunit